MAAVARLGGGRDHGCGQRVVFVQPVRKIQPVDGALTLAIALPERSGGDAADVAAHDDLHRQRGASAGKRNIGVRQGDQVIGYNVARLFKPEGGKLRQHLPFAGDKPQDAVKRRQPIRRHQDQQIVAAIDVAHLALRLGAEKRQIHRIKRNRQPVTQL